MAAARNVRSLGAPYATAGSGNLVAMIWKKGCEENGWRYRFNLFRLGRSGAVGQIFSPVDLVSIVRLTRVLAAELAHDGCLRPELRRELIDLADVLDDAAFQAD